MKILKLLAVAMLVFCILTLAGCGSLPPDNGNGTEDTTPTESTADTEADTSEVPDETEPEDIGEAPISYDELVGMMEASSQKMAVAYFGHFSNMDVDPFVYMEDRAPAFCSQMPFFEQIHRIIGDYMGELYCIIPADKDAKVTVSYNGIGPSGDYTSEVLYESEEGEPFIVFCNTGLTAEMLIEITESDGNTFSWIPRLDDNQYVSQPLNSNMEEMILDISPYAECLASNYLSMLDRETGDYILPTSEHLLNTTWKWDENLLDGTYASYEVTFHDKVADIRWSFGEEKHEYMNAPYTVEATDGISILTLDLGEFGGVHRYNLLTDPDRFMMYIVVDTTNGAIRHTDEKQYRFLYRDTSGDQ